MDILATRITSLDPARVWSGVPLVDRRVVLDAGVGALPRRGRDLSEQFTGGHGLEHLAGGDGLELPIGTGFDRLHELVSDPNRVVGVLVLNRERVLAVEIHVEPSVTKCTGLLFFFGLAPHELLNIGVIDIEHHHLRGAAGLTSTLDGSRRRIGAAHKADRPRRCAAALQVLDGRSDSRQVDTGSRPAFEDHAFFGVPVEDRLHGVVDRQDEARRCLLGHALDTDVEPHRTVEGHSLRDDEVLQLVLKDERFASIGEVGAFDPPLGNRVNDPVDDLTQRAFAFGGSWRSPKVLLRQNVRRVNRPRRRHFDVELFERDRSVAPIVDAGVTSMPVELVVHLDVGRGVDATKPECRSD